MSIQRQPPEGILDHFAEKHYRLIRNAGVNFWLLWRRDERNALIRELVLLSIVLLVLFLFSHFDSNISASGIGLYLYYVVLKIGVGYQFLHNHGI